MKKKVATPFIIAIMAIVMLTSCASSFELAQKALTKGDYTTAIAKSIDALKEDPASIEAKQVLDTAWTQANREWVDEITFLKSKNGIETINANLPDWVKSNLKQSEATVDDLKQISSVYDKLIQIHIIVENAKKFDLNPNSQKFINEQNEIKTQIADIYFTIGKESLQKSTRESAREALYYFMEVKKLNSNYPNVDAMYDQAEKQATVKLAIIQKSSNYKDELSSKLKAYYEGFDLIDVVYISNSGTTYEKAKISADNYDADLLLYFTTNIEINDKYRSNTRAVNPNINGAKDWKVMTYYYEIAGKNTINYILEDLNTNSILVEDSIKIDETTDLDFSFNVLTAKKGEADVVFTDFEGNSEKIRTSYATTTEEIDIYNFDNQFKIFEDIYIFNQVTAMSGSLAEINSNFDEFTDVQTLSKNKNLNGHTFIDFQSVKNELPDSDFYINTYQGSTASDRKQNYETDMFIRYKLEDKMESYSFQKNTLNLYLEDLNAQVYSKLKNQISPFIK